DCHPSPVGLSDPSQSNILQYLRRSAFSRSFHPSDLDGAQLISLNLIRLDVILALQRLQNLGQRCFFSRSQFHSEFEGQLTVQGSPSAFAGPSSFSSPFGTTLAA